MYVLVKFFIYFGSPFDQFVLEKSPFGFLLIVFWLWCHALSVSIFHFDVLDGRWKVIVSIPDHCLPFCLSVIPGQGHRQTVQTQIRRHRTWRLNRVCTVCENYRKLIVKWNNLKSPFRTIFTADAQRQSTHQLCQCFDYFSEIQYHPLTSIFNRWLMICTILLAS